MNKKIEHTTREVDPPQDPWRVVMGMEKEGWKFVHVEQSEDVMGTDVYHFERARDE